MAPNQLLHGDNLIRRRSTKPPKARKLPGTPPPPARRPCTERLAPMEIQCECGKFRAELRAFPGNTPGRLVCYCDDCQMYMRHLGRTDLLDANGGTEVIPAYPADVKVLQGLEHLKCTRLTATGTFRFSTSCCNTPIANARPGEPWMGFLHCVYTAGDARTLDQTFGPVRSRIMGRYAKGTPPAGTPNTFDLRAMVTVLPFLLKGKILRKSKASPFFADDGITSIVAPQVLTEIERQAARG